MRSLLDTLERRLGFIAVPGLVRYIMFLQVGIWIMAQLNGTALQGLGQWVAFSASRILSGEWWRAFTFIFYPTGGGVLWMLMSAMFMIWAADVIEQAWGSFRLTLYMLASMLCVLVHGLFVGAEGLNSFFILEGLTMAFALYAPEVEIMLYGIIPLRMKWIGWIAAGHCFFVCFGTSLTGHVLASLVPFFVVFGPGFVQMMKHRSVVAQRRSRFAAAARADSEALSTCHLCGKTDVSHPQLEFRVTAEGKDICSDCRSR
jgi:hypothetical protein